VLRGTSLVLAAASAAALLLAGCGGNGTELRSEGSHQRARPAGLGVARKPVVAKPAVTTKARRCTTGSFEPSQTQAYAAVVRRRVAVIHAWPSAGAPVRQQYTRIDQNGFPTVLGVVGSHIRGCRPVWFRAQLPSRPNGSDGWVRAADVSVYPVNSSVVVDLSTRRLFLYASGRLAMEARVAVGTVQTPTPTGRFYVNERFRLDSPDGPFGVAALGISAHSNVLQNWIQGGPIALHGTNDPASIGSAASHGCVRLRNADMRRLFRLVPAGTPVLIRQ
jgi:hypothetical protein